MNFTEFRNAVKEKFDYISDNSSILLEVENPDNILWDKYINAFPEGTNPIFRVRREYDCSCCRNYIRNIGAVIGIINGEKVSIWDVEVNDPVFQSIANKMKEYVLASPIKDPFFTKVKSHGCNRNSAIINSNIYTFDHFYSVVPFNYLADKDSAETKCAQARDKKNVFQRSLEELTLDSIDTILELISQGSIYRGKENESRIKKFREYKIAYMQLVTNEDKELFVWDNSAKESEVICKIKNSAIGSLLVDISNDVELNEAVRKYEAMVAPENYHRPKAIYTKKMLEEAKKTIEELGYLNSLGRRYANLDDITVNNILFSNKDSAKRIKGANLLFDEMEKAAVVSPKKFDNVAEIGIEDFINNVLPSATSVEAYVENKHTKNFVSLIAPIVSDSKTMFKWNNNFSWAYTGNLADSSIKTNVKNAGGKVDGVLRFSIQWNDIEGMLDNNDLDAHCIMPNRHHIYYRNKHDCSSGGYLDVDIISPRENVPAVENIAWENLCNMPEGFYKFYVNKFSDGGGKSGFRAEIEFNGQIYYFDHKLPVNKNNVEVAIVELKNGKFSIKPLMPSTNFSKEIWGITTNNFIPVSVICNSPNYWDKQNGIGNKHYFFMLKDCINPEEPNAWYNEYLKTELVQKHKRIFEALGSKAHVENVKDQLSGLGFSSTRKDELIVKVKGATERVLKIIF